VEPWKPESHEQNRVVMDIVARAAAGYADAGYFTVVDGIVMPRWFYEPLRDGLRGAGHGVAYAILRPPLEICLARAASGGGVAEPSVLERLWGEFDGIGALERNVVDTGDMTPGQAAEVVARRFRDDELSV
jgi:hypothetical protein